MHGTKIYVPLDRRSDDTSRLLSFKLVLITDLSSALPGPAESCLISSVVRGTSLLKPQVDHGRK
jgi:hypothetical protein